MHEYAVTQSIIRTVTEEAEKAGVQKISEIRLVVGDLSTILDDSVQLYFDMLSEGTPAAGARLVFKRIPAEFRCGSCGHLFEKPRRGFDCPLCGAPGTLTGRGKEFYIESIEAE